MKLSKSDDLLEKNMVQLLVDARPAKWQQRSRKSKPPRGKPPQIQPDTYPNVERKRTATKMRDTAIQRNVDKNRFILTKVALIRAD